MAKNKRKSQEQIPDMIEEVVFALQRKIDQLHAVEELSTEDTKLLISLLKELNTAHLSYRMLKQEAEDKIKSIPLDQINKIIAEAQKEMQNGN